jgi:hypothetical protein
VAKKHIRSAYQACLFAAACYLTQGRWWSVKWHSATAAKGLQLQIY